MSIAPESLRIGEFARRVGVNAALLRAWERRYGLLHPSWNRRGAVAKRVPLLLSGPAASDALCTQLGVRRLNGDLVTAANEIARRSNG